MFGQYAPNELALPSRRRFLQRAGLGLGSVALGTLLHEQTSAVAAPVNPLAARPPLFPAKAKRIVWLFMTGAPSQVDTWDYKPELQKRNGETLPGSDPKTGFFTTSGKILKSPFGWNQHGKSGSWVSDIFPHMSKHVDDMAFIHSMQNKSALHGPAMFMMNSGFIRPGFPSMGSWVTYGLGCETDNLPSFVVLPDVRGLPPGGAGNWNAGFLPAVHQGTIIETATDKPPIANLFPANAQSNFDGARREFLRFINRQHADERPADSLLEARIASYELAAKLQLSAPEAVDLARETDSIHQLYALADEDIGPFGRQCLLARRFVERGVRFVQIFCGAENTSSKKIRPNWDSHEDIVRDHGYWGRILDTGVHALLSDLKSRGLLDSTLVFCTTEFGRQPFMQGQQLGRDHNPGVFTSWLAGGGIKGGTSYGTSDEVGFKAAENPTYSYDLHATALHLLGIDHERLTYYQNGIQRRLTDVHGQVIRDII